MKFILGQKIGMSQIYNGDKIVPVTVLEAGPCLVTQAKTEEKDGYKAWQIGFGEKKRVNKPMKGHLKELGNLRYLKEFKSTGEKDDTALSVGDKIDVAFFTEGDAIKVVSISKGHGFTGVVKRHGFKGGPKSHGQKHQHRAPGSIGRSFPERVLKGMRMAGRSGNMQVTINTKIAKIDKENNLLLVVGPVPGRRGTLVSLTSK